MNSNQASLQRDELHDSWVELHYQNNGQNSPKKDLEASGVYTALNIEKLLKDAQRESATSSREASARGSPKSLHSPTNELASGVQEERADVGTDWIWDWSSGPEISQDIASKFRHPVSRPRYSVRHTPLMKRNSVFCLENLPTLFFSHACIFICGMAIMFFYAKKRFHCAHCALD